MQGVPLEQGVDQLVSFVQPAGVTGGMSAIFLRKDELKPEGRLDAHEPVLLDVASRIARPAVRCGGG